MSFFVVDGVFDIGFVLLFMAMLARAFVVSPRLHGETKPRFGRDIAPAAKWFGLLGAGLILLKIYWEHHATFMK